MRKSPNRVVVVTGGSRGIGRSVCYSLADGHSIIYFSYHSDKKAAKITAEQITKIGSKAVYKQLDVSNSNAVSNFFRFVLKEAGQIDILINNAGISNDSLLVRMNEKNWNRVIDVNLKGTFNCIKAVSRIMLKQKYGRIINIGSIVGIMGNPGQSNYAASKAGIIGLTKTAARELASRNITVNVVAPGYIDTAMTNKLPDTDITRILEQIPLGRAGQPYEVSSVVSFLASKDASYITGQVINVNGGIYM